MTTSKTIPGAMFPLRGFKGKWLKSSGGIRSGRILPVTVGGFLAFPGLKGDVFKFMLALYQKRVIRFPVPEINRRPAALSCSEICSITSPITSPWGGLVHSSKTTLFSKSAINLPSGKSLSITNFTNSSSVTKNDSRCRRDSSEIGILSTKG